MVLKYKELVEWFCFLRPIERFLLFVFSLLILSPIGSNVVLVFGGKYIPEVILIPIFLWGVLSKSNLNYFIAWLSSKVFVWVSLMVIVFLLFLGVILHGNLISAYAAARAIFFLLLGWWLFSYYNSGDLRRNKEGQCLLFFLVFSSAFFQLSYFIFMSDGAKSPYSIALILFISCMAAASRSLLFVLMSIFLIILMALSSSFRAYWGYAFFCFVGVFISKYLSAFRILGWKLYIDKVFIFGLSLAILLIFILVGFLYDDIYEWLASDPRRYHQTIYKFELLYNALFMNGESGVSESDRIDQFYTLFSGWDRYLLPSGFYDRSDRFFGSLWSDEYSLAGGGSPVNDGVYLYLSMTFGFFLGGGLLIWYLCCFAMAWISASFSEKVIRSFVFVVLLMVFLGQGAVVLVISQSFFLGAFLYFLSQKKNRILVDI